MRRECVYGCGGSMNSDRKEGESDLEWYERDSRIYDGHRLDCPARHEARKAWSLRIYGVEDVSEADRIRGTVKLTIEVTVDARYYTRQKAQENLERDMQGPDGLAAGISGGGIDWRIVNKKIKSIRWGKERTA